MAVLSVHLIQLPIDKKRNVLLKLPFNLLFNYKRYSVQYFAYCHSVIKTYQQTKLQYEPTCVIFYKNIFGCGDSD